MDRDSFDGLGVHLLHIIDQQLLDPIKRSFEKDLDSGLGIDENLPKILAMIIALAHSLKITILYSFYFRFLFLLV